jgi:hypothetical protein
MFRIGIPLRRWLAFCAGIGVVLQAHAANTANRARQLEAYIHAASTSLAIEQRQALAAIQDADRRRLALTFYLRAGAAIGARWSWTADRIRAYEQSAEFQAARLEIEKVSARFSADNPGYALHVNTRVRSLEEQLSQWQSVRSIGTAALELRTALLAELATPTYPKSPDAAANERFRKFLSNWRASNPPTLAAPGMSLHGRGRAYDFQIRDAKGRTIAGTDTSIIRSIWDGQGWTEKLSKAVHSASGKFVGPLASSREPWHYEYRPE